MIDRYYTPNSPAFNYLYFYVTVEIEYPGWIRLEKTIKRFLEKFTSVDKYYPYLKLDWRLYVDDADSDSDY